MSVIIKYVVERSGEEKMIFTSKVDADAYDKMLDMADELFTLLDESKLVEDETQREKLSLFLAQNKEELLQVLGAKRKATPKKKKDTEAEIQDAVHPEQDQGSAEENTEAA